MYPGLSPSIHFWPECSVDCASVEAGFFIESDHRPRFNRQMDREVWEGIPAGVREVVAAHDVSETCPRHLRPEFITVKARCSRYEAINLADALAVLDADERLASEVYRWVRHRGAEATLSYLHKFIVAVAEVESETPDDLADIPTGKLREYAKALGEPPRFGRHHVVAAVRRAEERLNDHTESETIGYHKLGECSDDCIDNDWISRQPSWFKMLLSKVMDCKSNDELKELGKAVFASNVTGDRASVFWSFYNIRKRYLESRLHLSRVARDFINRIRSAGHSQLSALGRNLFKLQRGLIKGPLFRSHEWSAIWAAYNEAKATLPARAA
jgi:hypothetical protein